jgi:D-proline reductase (dithiol) PrdB
MIGTEQPVRYIPRTREYYRAIGYAKDYVWSCYEDVPFTRLEKPLAQAQIALITTAAPLDLSNKDARGVKHVWSGKVEYG